MFFGLFVIQEEKNMKKKCQAKQKITTTKSFSIEKIENFSLEINKKKSFIS